MSGGGAVPAWTKWLEPTAALVRRRSAAGGTNRLRAVNAAANGADDWSWAVMPALRCAGLVLTVVVLRTGPRRRP